MDELIFALLFIVLVASAIYKYCELQHQINLCMIFSLEKQKNGIKYRHNYTFPILYPVSSVFLN